MKNFNELHKTLIKEKKISVHISNELMVSVMAKDSDHIVELFNELIFTYGVFHSLLDKCHAHGDYHELVLTPEKNNILMNGVSYNSGS